MVEPERRPRLGGLEADPPCPSGSRRPPDRKRQATPPQDAPERHRTTAGCAPAARRSISRARLTPGWPRSRQGRRTQRAPPGCCPALRREDAETTRRDPSRSSPRCHTELDPKSRIKLQRPEASARQSQRNQAQNSLEMLKIITATARQHLGWCRRSSRHKPRYWEVPVGH